MKGKRDTTEDKIRILRDADQGKNILEVCRQHHISEMSFHRLKNCFLEGFHGPPWHECLSQKQTWTLTEARVVIDDLRCHYNERRPHCILGCQRPARFAALQRPPTPASLIEAGQSNPTQLQPNHPWTNSLARLRKTGLLI